MLGYSALTTQRLCRTLWYYVGWYFNTLKGGTAESTESTLAGQDSTLRLPVVAVKVHVGVLYDDYTTPP
jgi:hypothetical protein